MRLVVKSFKLSAGRPIAFLHENDAKELHLRSGERVVVSAYSGVRAISAIDIVTGLFKQGEIALSEELTSTLQVKPHDKVTIAPCLKPKSLAIIRKRKESKKYTRPELRTIIQDIVNNALSEAEIAYFVSDVYYEGLSITETADLTRAIVDTGQRLNWNTKNVVDKHSIGGVPGNRTTPIVVSICASAGIIMPKTSSRAITSAAGTADVIETLTKVDLTADVLKKVVQKTGACLAWGGSLGLAPADDKLIKVERNLNLDPQSQLLASILAKKLAVGSKYVLIDIPAGAGAKVSQSKAQALKNKFIQLGKELGLKIKVVITDGSQPIGNGIGPSLEMKDIISVLQNDGPSDLRNKSLFLAGEIFEMMGVSKSAQGVKKAKEILESGQAFAKFSEIIKAQGGSIRELPFARIKKEIKSTHSGKVNSIDNKGINYIGRLLGSPEDKSAGLYLHKHVGDKVSKNENIMTLYSESEYKMKEAINYVKQFYPIHVHN